MTGARAMLAYDPAAYVRPSARVSTVAEMLECYPGDVRRMINAGEIEAHGKGVRGIRVFLDSVADYQARKAVKPKVLSPVIPKRKPRSPASTAAFRSAMAGLKAKGIV